MSGRSLAATLTLLSLMLFPVRATGQSHAEAAEQALLDRNYRMAVVHHQRALRERPDDAALHAGLAESYLRWGRWESAREHAELALAQDSTQVTALLVVARCHVRAQEWAAAVARFEGVLAVDPVNVEARAGVVQALRASGDAAAAEAAQARFEP